MAKKTAKKSPKKAPKKAPKKVAARSDDNGPAGPLHLPLLEKLTAMMAEHDLSNIELQDGDQKIILNRGPMHVAAPMAAAPMAAPQASAPAAAPSPASSAPAASPAAAPEADKGNLVEITSPMVGTFYARPSPDAKVFVDVGSKVNADTDVCLIEAMKVFNNIKAETSGTIEKMLVSDGDAVEFGQALFLVKPS